MPNSWETCEVSIGGQVYNAWESVMVRNDFTNPPPVFTLVTDGQAQINPGDEATIKLAGKTALSGFVNVIQPAYDAKRHRMQVQGRSFTQDPIDCSIMLKEANKGNFDGYTLQAIGDKLFEKYKTKFKVENGDAANVPFDKAQAMPGESPYNMIERLARQRKLYLIHDENGDLLAVSNPIGTASGTLEEGKNIKACRAVISDMSLMKKVVGLAQRNGSDKESGRKVAEPQVETEDNPDCKRDRQLCILTERWSTDQDLKHRVATEAQWRGAVTIDATITVYGWLTEGKSGDLWKPAHSTTVKSPMARLNQQLWIKAVTFTQDNHSGTQTHIELLRYPQGQIPLLGDGTSQDLSPMIVPPAP